MPRDAVSRTANVERIYIYIYTYIYIYIYTHTYIPYINVYIYVCALEKTNMFVIFPLLQSAGQDKDRLKDKKKTLSFDRRKDNSKMLSFDKENFIL